MSAVFRSTSLPSIGVFGLKKTDFVELEEDEGLDIDQLIDKDCLKRSQAKDKSEKKKMKKEQEEKKEQNKNLRKAILAQSDVSLTQPVVTAMTPNYNKIMKGHRRSLPVIIPYQNHALRFLGGVNDYQPQTNAAGYQRLSKTIAQDVKRTSQAKKYRELILVPSPVSIDLKHDISVSKSAVLVAGDAFSEIPHVNIRACTFINQMVLLFLKEENPETRLKCIALFSKSASAAMIISQQINKLMTTFSQGASTSLGHGRSCTSLAQGRSCTSLAQK